MPFLPEQRQRLLELIDQRCLDHLQSLIENNQELEATKRLEGDVFAALDAAVADLDTDNVSALSMRLLIDKVLVVR